MGHFPKEMLDKQLNFAICTYNKSQDSFPSMAKMAKHRSYHCTFHNLSLHVLSYHCSNWQSLHTKIRYDIKLLQHQYPIFKLKVIHILQCHEFDLIAYYGFLTFHEYLSFGFLASQFHIQVAYVFLTN